MKKIQKTYGVYNLMEWQCSIGGTTINFTGGAFTGYGVRPAQFTTKELFLQTLIERSPFFTKGRIKLVKSIPTNEDIIVQKPARKKAVVAEVQTETLATETPTTTTKDEGATLTARPMRILNVTDRDDAVQKLNKVYGVPMRKLKTRALILSEATAAGVKLVGWPEE